MFEYAVPFRNYEIIMDRAFGPQIATDIEGEHMVLVGMFWVIQVVGLNPGVGKLGTHFVCMN